VVQRMDPRYFDNEDDIKVLVEGVKKAVFLAENTTTFSTLGTSFTKTVLPGCENVPFRSDEYFECYIRTYSVTLHHIVGTCAMGRNDSKDAVVDPELRVIGVKGLRVIDASIMPVVPVSNTQAPTIMIAEKGADMIWDSWYIPDDEQSETTTESEPIIIIEPSQNASNKSTSGNDSSNSVLSDCDYCELDGRKDVLDVQFVV